MKMKLPEILNILQTVINSQTTLIDNSENDKESVRIFQDSLTIYSKISEEILSWNNKAFFQSLENSYNYIFDIVDKININKKITLEIREIISLLRDSLRDTYDQLDIRDTKYKLLIYGTNEKTAYYSYCIDYKKTNVIAYIETEKQDKEYYLGSPIVSKKHMKDLNYDYILLAESIDNIDDIPFEKIIDYNYYIRSFVMGGYELAYERLNFYKNQKPYDGIITGLSYMRQGIDLNRINGHFLCFAIGGQDLYYSYKMFKHAYENAIEPDRIKYSIIGICAYSLQYDASLSQQNSILALKYYSYLKTMNQFQAQLLYKSIYHDCKNKADMVLKENHEEEYLTQEEEYFLNYEKALRSVIYDSSSLTSKEIEEEHIAIDKEFHKNYPETRERNIAILDEFLKYLKERNIKTIIVMPPMTSLYKKYMSQDMLQDTLDVLNTFKEKYNFIYIDLLNELELEDKYFRNSSHLNGLGAIKVTEYLNQYLEN